MNKELLTKEAQDYINAHLNDDVTKIAMAKSPLPGIESRELANQVASKKKAQKKLPTWFNTSSIYYPPALSIEQTSSEPTAAYKSGLAIGDNLVDLTGGFGVDTYFFSKKLKNVIHCEINEELHQIATYNSSALGQENTIFLHIDGIEFLNQTHHRFNTIYIDPARRSSQGKVFMLRDCSPNVVENLDLLLEKADRVIIKTAPLLDITAGLRELKNVIEIHVVSVKNECKELLWILEKNDAGKKLKITAAALNDKTKTFVFAHEEIKMYAPIIGALGLYLYEPDAALLKTGAFDLISAKYQVAKLGDQTQLYTSDEFRPDFPGRIFKIEKVLSSGDLKKEQNLTGNVIVRNYRDKAELLVKKHRIQPHDTKFLIFTQSDSVGFIVIFADILQHY
ncbi:MAG: hypothetical protein V4687_18195 [Bacteroidota bacterium]